MWDDDDGVCHWGSNLGQSTFGFKVSFAIMHNVLLYFVIHASLCKQLLRRRKYKQSHLKIDVVNEVEEEWIDLFSSRHDYYRNAGQGPKQVQFNDFLYSANQSVNLSKWW